MKASALVVLAQDRAFGQAVCRFHRADLFSDGHHKKRVQGGVVFGGDAKALLSVLRKPPVNEERFNPMQTTRVIKSSISTADWLEVMRS